MLPNKITIQWLKRLQKMALNDGKLYLAFSLYSAPLTTVCWILANRRQLRWNQSTSVRGHSSISQLVSKIVPILCPTWTSHSYFSLVGSAMFSHEWICWLSSPLPVLPFLLFLCWVLNPHSFPMLFMLLFFLLFLLPIFILLLFISPAIIFLGYPMHFSINNSIPLCADVR